MKLLFSFVALLALLSGINTAFGQAAPPPVDPGKFVELSPPPVSAPAPGGSSATFPSSPNPTSIAAVNNASKSHLFRVQTSFASRPVFTLVGAPPGAAFLGASTCINGCTVGMSFRVTTGAGVYQWRLDVREVAGGPVVGTLYFVVTVT